mmetsp:Transcript_1785/g.2569  ORF Transcript_1785/g.2569 Transcript_1785/m.2569 type:complete len:338 (-) Transcript_1785:28-1041(-)
MTTIQGVMAETMTLIQEPGSLSVPSGASSQNLLLDSAIRDWVVLPLLIILILAGLLRHHISIILRPTALKKTPYPEHRVRNVLMRASKLRQGGAGFLSKSKWEARRCYWADKEKGYLREEMDWVEEEDTKKKESEEGGGDTDMPDPMAMLGPMKGQFAAMMQNMAMMQGISYLFQGYVLVKVPFDLTIGFKGMFQRGLDLSTLDTSYVSSASWYFLVMFGLRAFFGLVIQSSMDGEQETKESNRLQVDFGLTKGGGPPGQNFDAKGALKMEIENLEIAKQNITLDDAEKRLLGKKYPKKKLVSGISNKPGNDIFGFENAPSTKGKKLKKEDFKKSKK